MRGRWRTLETEGRRNIEKSGKMEATNKKEPRVREGEWGWEMLERET